ncbi:acetylcholinesterase-like [Paramacrobiotus metropolitanus]|uniref:acetylcholinesterase-like n=1 Tax=Paramacrobiotus metropolitanus TaxID=2943436 RepID=UPI00244563F1|nr:acetylcholinesterase-like [Paramacrobiotus metropolitanus]XP_055327581.1 acetylcholinesterase-like [Paramacrobiotus metropolitanus]XP_055327582.1 acetylcholinesterase-like [Paramacrobiotus metropolitanus]XP_055327583.1 acetylcholinesterase-like [Paramacrobiotus metropolitanus]XP_055327584.1 acetylcholinesterase-like [Paramacrobiotus metropolitanus]
MDADYWLFLLVIVFASLTDAQFGFADPQSIGVRYPYPGPNLYQPNNPFFKPQFESDDVFVTVETTKGKVTGRVVRLYDGPGREWDKRHLAFSNQAPYMPWLNVTVFLGIPYAEPPLRDLRFMPPREKPAWRPATLPAIRYGAVCPQPERFIEVVKNRFNMSEDCLYLNVFTPNITELTFPVMVFIHGGGFYWGASDIYPGHVLSASQGVVVVTFNYRLGALGFLSTGDINSPGNYGMLDQRMAIEWVKNNIRAFRGDPDRITIFGQSSGAASVGLHTLSFRSRGLFRSAIAQSGSELAPWSVIKHWEHAWNNSRKFGEHVNCPTYSSDRLVNCLRYSRSEVDLARAVENFQPDIGLFGFAPVVDIPQDRGILAPDFQFLPNKPEVLLRSGAYDSRMPFLSGVTEDEGYGFLKNNDIAKTKRVNYLITTADMDDAIRDLLKRENYTQNAAAVEAAVRFMYTHWPDPKNETMRRKQYVNLFSDIYYKSPAYKSINLRASIGAPVYQYVLNYSIEATRNITDPMFSFGFVPHMEDLHFVFGFPFLNDPRHDNYTPPVVPPTLRRYDWKQGDRNMSDFMMQMWANFAKYENPTPWRVCNTSWEKYTLMRDSYLVLNMTNTSYIYQGYRPLESAFWIDYLPGQFFPTTMAPWPTESPIEFDRRRYMIATYTTVVLGGIILIVLIVVCTLYIRQRKGLDEMEF